MRKELQCLRLFSDSDSACGFGGNDSVERFWSDYKHKSCAGMVLSGFAGGLRAGSDRNLRAEDVDRADRRTDRRSTPDSAPILLLDDIFDKLDAHRVEKIVELVSGSRFGQIFITDTNRDHLDQILSGTTLDYKIFHVENGEIHS
jgi:hypothetical protein